MNKSSIFSDLDPKQYFDFPSSLIDFSIFQNQTPISQIYHSYSFMGQQVSENCMNLENKQEKSNLQDNQNDENTNDNSKYFLQKQQKKRTSNTTLKPILTCAKSILFKLDNSFSGFFPRFMKKNQNSVRKQFFQWFLSFAQFQSISLNGFEINFVYFMNKQKFEFDNLIKQQFSQGKKQRANQTQQFVDLFYSAMQQKDYKKRMQILFKGRKHSLSNIEAKRKQFEQFKLENK